MIVYNKLIRDRIPEIIRNDNKVPNLRLLNKNEFKSAVLTKFNEEIAELKESTDREDILNELADVLELIYTYGQEYNISPQEIEEKRELKEQKRGGFSKKLFLISVDD
ncbi:MAG: nucleoside triphosphate pyrophosphohydrolase [Candidatus Heimdallarchaeota archaeon]|nr:nucleoside triphosphate pyrophosphohydrolase [Candidatus Heimdallarchaeota archaeon]